MTGKDGKNNKNKTKGKNKSEFDCKQNYYFFLN